MKAFLAVLLVVVSFISYLVLSRRISYNQQIPVLHYLGMLVGIGLLILLMNQAFTTPRLVALCFSLFVVGLFTWYTTSFSAYDNNRATIVDGDFLTDKMKTAILTPVTGGEINLGDIVARDKATLLVFFRAHW
ncbi:MAG: hypothetical protein ABIK68_06690 [bacterium]